MANAGMKDEPLMISDAQVVSTLTYEELIPAVERGLGDFSKRAGPNGGGGIHPQRVLMNIEKNEGFVLVMTVFNPADDIVATKIVTRFVKNGERFNIPSGMSTIVLIDGQNGVTKAIVDAAHITGMRTAAASAVATKYLAKEGSKILAILGAGMQAECHADALRHVMNLSEIRVWTRSFEKAQAFAKRHNVKACRTAREAVTGADVIATCTQSVTPLLNASWLKPKVHINAVGAIVPWAQELGAEVMKKATVYTDTLEGALKESGDIIKSKVDVFGEIGDVINGSKEARRGDITVFKSQGLAIEDAVAAKLVYDKILAKY